MALVLLAAACSGCGVKLPECIKKLEGSAMTCPSAGCVARWV